MTIESAVVSRTRGLPFVVIFLSAHLACAVAGSQGKSLPAPAEATKTTEGPEAAPQSIAPDGIELVPVKAGCFPMGNAFERGGPEEKPVHEVCVDEFYMGKYELTRDEWLRVMGTEAPTSNLDCVGTCPVDMVSWDDAQAFIARLNAGSAQAASARRYRLPTEAEWEYAARSGGRNELYAGAGTDLDRLAWHVWNGGVVHEVGLKAPNGLGLHDMSGNVWEWTGDWYGATYYATSPRMNPTGPSSGDRRVLRGGSVTCEAFDLRASYRNYLPPGYRGTGKGMRVVLGSAREAAPVVAAAQASPPAAAATGTAPASTLFEDPATGMKFVRVEGGCFQMGERHGDVMENDVPAPAHEVCVDTFYIGKYEVTRGQWRSLMPIAPPTVPECGRDTCPIENVTYRDIQEFVRKMNAKAGAERYRLPTEAEWEYAARSGGKNERYSGGNDVESVSVFACEARRAPCTLPVGSKLPNGLGIHDMSGNVYELTSDWLDPTYYSVSPRENPRGPKSGRGRAERGGCGSGSPRNSRTSRRVQNQDPIGMSGFRLVRVP